MGSEQRRHARATSYAKVVLTPSGVPGYIRDLSQSGCHVSFIMPVGVSVGDEIRLEVTTGGGIDIPVFTLRLVVRWKKEDGLYFSVGGETPGDWQEPTGSPFERLVEYYAGEFPPTSAPGPRSA